LTKISKLSKFSQKNNLNFPKPLYIAWNVFLLLLYLQVGPLRLPYPPPNGGEIKILEGSADVEGSADGYTDDEDIRITRRSTNVGSTKDDPGKPWVDYLTLYTSKNADRSYLLSHEALQAQSKFKKIFENFKVL